VCVCVCVYGPISGKRLPRKVVTCKHPAGHYKPPLIILPPKNGRANEWRITAFDLHLSPFRVDLDGPLYTLVPPSYPERDAY